MLTQNSKKRQQTQASSTGFTLIEVLAGILMATAFVLVAVQAIAISAVYRVRAQRESEALQWIQEDFENIKFGSLAPLTATCNATTTIAGYGLALKTYTESTAFYNSIAPDPNGDGDNNRLTRNLLNKSYLMNRDTDVYNVAPYNTMTVSYSISDPESDPNAERPIASFYTEVIPDAAFNCN